MHGIYHVFSKDEFNKVLFYDLQHVACNHSQKYYFFANRCIMHTSDFSFTVLDTVDSTNNYAMAKVHAGLARQGDAWFTSSQTQGKGQRGKIWLAQERQNIALSIVLQPNWLNVSQQFHISVAVSLAAYDFYSGLAGKETFIKWPNDIYWNDRKAGGILLENIFHGKRWPFCVAGIGININQQQFDASITNAISLSQVTKEKYDLEKLARELQQHVLKRFKELQQMPFSTLLEEYNQHLYCLDKTVRLKKGTIVFDTVIKGVTSLGQLITIDSMERNFDFGEVTMVV